MTDDIEARVIDVIARTQYLPSDSITAESTFEELEIDSLAGLAVVSELEKEFGVTIPNEQVFVIRDVRQTVSALSAALDTRGAAAAASERS
jgi:acyl carrier protein